MTMIFVISIGLKTSIWINIAVMTLLYIIQTREGLANGFIQVIIYHLNKFAKLIKYNLFRRKPAFYFLL